MDKFNSVMFVDHVEDFNNINKLSDLFKNKNYEEFYKMSNGLGSPACAVKKYIAECLQLYLDKLKQLIPKLEKITAAEAEKNGGLIVDVVNYIWPAPNIMNTDNYVKKLMHLCYEIQSDIRIAKMKPIMNWNSGYRGVLHLHSSIPALFAFVDKWEHLNSTDEDSGKQVLNDMRDLLKNQHHASYFPLPYMTIK